MAVTLNASTSSGLVQTADTSGEIQLQSNGTTELTVTSTGVTVADNLLFNSGYGSAVIGYGCRAWVNFNGTGTPAIRASGNVSSITDNGTGLFTANYTTAMPDGNYTSNITTRYTGSGDTLVSCIQGSSFSTTSIAVRIMDSGFALKDPTEVSIAIFR
jgi:hypothetical protein